MAQGYCLVVEKVRAGSGMVEGQVLHLSGPCCVFGRGAGAQVSLEDPRISRQHAVFRLGAEGWVVENLSRFGTWLNQEPIEAPVFVRLGDRLQMGGVLLAVARNPSETEPPTGPMSLATAPPPIGRLLVITPSSHDVVFLGQPLTLQPSPFRALARLAQEPGCFVSFEALELAIWGDSVLALPGYVNKYISYVRTALKEAIMDHPARQSQLLRLVGASEDHPSPEALSLAMRQLLQARKSVGYCLKLPPDSIEVL